MAENQEWRREQQRIDDEATMFAMALLMPEEFVRKAVSEMGGIDLDDEKAVRSLAHLFQVSTQMMTVRLAELRERDSCYGCATQRHACKHDAPTQPPEQEGEA